MKQTTDITRDLHRRLWVEFQCLVFSRPTNKELNRPMMYIPAGCGSSNSRHSDGEFDTHNYVFVCVFQLV